jgi:hypothetical protein
LVAFQLVFEVSQHRDDFSKLWKRVAGHPEIGVAPHHSDAGASAKQNVVPQLLTGTVRGDDLSVDDRACDLGGGVRCYRRGD